MYVSSGTDLESFGFVKAPARTVGRNLLITVDFEAFRAKSLKPWLSAMRQWARRARETQLRTCFFLATENVALLRRDSEALYEEFLGGLSSIHAAGGEFHPHNHYLFDPSTGSRPVVPGTLQAERSYGKRPSMFFDVARRHGTNLAGWLEELFALHDEVLTAARIALPARRAFRAGGWDYGSTRAEVETYLEALESAGVSIDSSATAGTFGTKSWRVGTPFGSNVFWVSRDLLEVAPTVSIDCGAPSLSRTSAATVWALLGQPKLWRRNIEGAIVVVLHFDHLLRDAETNAHTIGARVDRLFRSMSGLRRVTGASATTFAHLGVNGL